jgi:paraquat-inducible protein B
MSEKPHTVAIGAFVIGALLIGVTLVLFALGSGFGRDRETIVMVFDGSVKGLTVGAPLALRGVNIGQVTNIELMLDSDTVELIMLVEAELRGDDIRRVGHNDRDLTEELIARGLRAQLGLQSLLTGLLYIQLDFHPDTKVVLGKIESPYTQIPTIPTDMQQLAAKLEEMDLAKLADNIQATIEGLNSFVTSENFQALPENLNTTLLAVTELSTQLRQQIASSGTRLNEVLDGAAVTLASADKELPKISGLAERNLELLAEAITAFEITMKDLDTMISPDSPTSYELNKALQEFAMASRAIRLLARTLEEQPESLIRGKQEDAQ